jgi:hypothetical protein
MTRAQTAQHKGAFLEHFARMGNISKACEAAGISRRVVYDWQEKDEQFSAAFQESNIIATETLEAEAWRRATESSDTLLIFLLKARNPARYREKPPEELSPERVLRFVEAVMTSVKQHVGDPGVLAAIGADLGRINGRNGSSVAPVRRDAGRQATG